MQLTCPRCRHEHPPRQCPRVLVVVPLEHRLAEIARLQGKEEAARRWGLGVVAPWPRG